MRKEVKQKHMKYYLANFEIRDGDNEYEFQFLVQAANLEDAETKAIDGLCYNGSITQFLWRRYLPATHGPLLVNLEGPLGSPVVLGTP